MLPMDHWIAGRFDFRTAVRTGADFIEVLPETGRFLDPPEFAVLTQRQRQNVFDRVD